MAGCKINFTAKTVSAINSTSGLAAIPIGGKKYIVFAEFDVEGISTGFGSADIKIFCDKETSGRLGAIKGHGSVKVLPRYAIKELMKKAYK